VLERDGLKMVSDGKENYVHADGTINDRNFLFLEELAIINEAMVNYQMGHDVTSVEELKNKMLFDYFELIDQTKFREANQIITYVIPEIVGDLQDAVKQNRVLSKKDDQLLEDMLNFAMGRNKVPIISGGFINID